MKYADYLLKRLCDQENYTHCFFVAGGNIMHLLDSARKHFECVPVIHEVAAGIAAEYFNETNENGKKAFALVTAGPGLTNIVTAVAGAHLESRELLVIGGQVKVSDLKSPDIRQKGIQEIDGKRIVEPITKSSTRLRSALPYSDIRKVLYSQKRPGPVFIEIPLDVQATEFAEEYKTVRSEESHDYNEKELTFFLDNLISELKNCSRPVILIGGGVHRSTARKIASDLEKLTIPVMTTWNGMDRYTSELSNYWGRPNTWGQRSANILIQQSDLLVAIGTRLGLQQTGFAWEQFAPLAKIFQVDIDPGEINKGHPKIESGLVTDANKFIEKFALEVNSLQLDIEDWKTFGKKVIHYFPLNDPKNLTSREYISPYVFAEKLSNICNTQDSIIPCSSGGAFTTMMQAFKVKRGQKVVTNKGLASMGYGLSGAIGAAISTGTRTVLVEGDGGFAQNLQELGTLIINNLNIKVFVFSNSGYASIRMTQKNYFGGSYIGCDINTGLGLPNWELIAKAYEIPFQRLDGLSNWEAKLEDCMNMEGPVFVEVMIDPDQTYFPKISSQIDVSGQIVSNPLHLMSPDLNDQEKAEFLPFLEDRLPKEGS